MLDQIKKPWQSKTLILNAVVAVLALAYPPAAEWIQAHPDIILASFAAINFILRLVTKDKIGLAE